MYFLFINAVWLLQSISIVLVTVTVQSLEKQLIKKQYIEVPTFLLEILFLIVFMSKIIGACMFSCLLEHSMRNRKKKSSALRFNFCFFSFQLLFWEDWHWLLARSDHHYNKEKIRCCYKTVDFATDTSENGVCITQHICHIMISHDCS